MHIELLVFGGGPGGYAAAFLAADLGMSVVLVDAEDRLGGTCLLKGCIPSKALLHVARVLAEAHDLAEWGIVLEQTSTDLDALRARKDQLIDKLARGLKQLAKRRRVTTVAARGHFLDSQTLQLDRGQGSNDADETITFDHCIVATGSRPIMPRALRLPTPRVIDSTGALRLEDIPRRMLVVGGGYIGLEMGVIYAALGSEVTVVEMTDGLLPGVDRDLVRILHKRLSGRFAALHLETRVAGLVDRGDRIEALLEGNEVDGPQLFDRVLIATGREPASAGIGLETTQVERTEDGFLRVDARQQSTDPRIYAVGDVVGQPMLAHKASHQGKVAVEAIRGDAAAAFDVEAIPAVVFTDPEIAWAGLTETAAQAAGRPVTVAQYPWQASGRAAAVGRTDGLTKWILDPESGRVLGAGIVGAGAGELIAEAVLAMEMGSTIRDIAETIHPHPTLSETWAFAGEVALGIATEVYRPLRKSKT
ncbi:MAG: dihydrolipoyl dehydrogenase [Pirellulales bacterium]